jgi:hypothetical protein
MNDDGIEVWDHPDPGDWVITEDGGLWVVPDW